MLEVGLNVKDEFSGIDSKKWQSLVNTLSDLFNAASADVIKHDGAHFSVLTTSDNQENFLEKGMSWSKNTKTFCKYIIENKEGLYVKNASEDNYWKDAPFVESGKVCSYFGEPIFWPDGGVFGSFCVIDDKPTQYSEKLKNALRQLKLIIESDLANFCIMKELVIANIEKESAVKAAVKEETKRKSAEDRLYTQEAIVSATLNILVDAVFRINNKGMILAVNSQAEKMFGYRASELMGSNINMLMPKGFKEQHDKYIENYLDTGIKKVIGLGRKVEAKRKNGSIFPIRLSVSELRLNNEIQFVGLIEDVSETALYEEKLKKLALYDSLTNCANRNLMAQRFHYLIACAKRECRSFSLLYIDLNRFKHLNDTYGHKCGDTILAEVGNRLTRCTRETDLVARVGGDEFVIVFSHKVEPRKIETYLQKELAKSINFGKDKISVSASFGYAEYPVDGNNMDTLLDAADQRMYVKKKLGKI